MIGRASILVVIVAIRSVSEKSVLLIVEAKRKHWQEFEASIIEVHDLE